MRNRSKIIIGLNLVVLIVLIIILYGFSELAYLLQSESLTGFDQNVTDFIYQYRSKGLTKAVILITELGSAYAYLFLIPFIALAVYRLGHNRYLTLQAALILLSSFLINLFLKSEVGRQRPDVVQRLVEVHDLSLSFPSGHSMSAMAFYGFLIYLIFRLAKLNLKNVLFAVFIFLLIIAIGASRVYLGVHYPTDVVAGFAGGLIWLIFCIGSLRLFNYIRIITGHSHHNSNH